MTNLMSKPLSTTMSMDLIDAVVTTLHFYHSRAATRMIQSTEIAIVVDISQKKD